MLDDALLERIYARLAATLAPPAGPYVPLVVDGAPVGWLDRQRAERLARFGSVFRHADGTLQFDGDLADEPARTTALADVVQALAAEGALSAWRDEIYPAAPAPVGPVAFRIERAAARYFGILTRAAHVNGLVPHGAELGMWLARRSAMKAIDPGLLDNLVGGGIRVGTSVAETLRREAWEEAGITQSVIQRAVPSGAVRLCRTHPDGLQREIIYVHDLRLPGSYVPEGVDGEAVAHRLVALSEAAELIANEEGKDALTADASLVILDCLIRQGAIAPDAARYLALADLRWPPLTPGDRR